MNFAELSATVAEEIRLQTQRLIGFLPDLGAALVLILVGWLFARLARSLTRRLAGVAMEWASQHPGIAHGLARGSMKTRVPIAVGATAFWIVLLSFLAAAIEQLNVQALAGPISALAYYAPILLTAVLIALAGFVVGGLVNHWVTTSLAPVGATQSQMLGRLAQAGTVTIALIMAADQAGIHSTILILTLGIVLTALLGGIALAFAIGCGPIVGNLVASHYVGGRFAKGHTARVEGHTGVVREVTTAFVILDTDRGEVLIPARKFLEEISMIDTPAEAAGAIAPAPAGSDEGPRV